jgi:hypothetical protein
MPITNLIPTADQNFGNLGAYWYAENSTATRGQADPLGGTSVVKVVDNNTAGVQHYLINAPYVTFTSSNAATIQVYAKPAGLTQVQLSLASISGSGACGTSQIYDGRPGLSSIGVPFVEKSPTRCRRPSVAESGSTAGRRPLIEPGLARVVN